MGVYEDRGAMHWQQQNDRYLSSYSGGGAAGAGEGESLSPAGAGAGAGAGAALSPGSPRACTSCRKREPPDEPDECACAGCGARITDRYYLLALERRWHTPCLRCCECKMPLDSEQRCYARDSNIFCKNDYFRLYGSKRCARCNTPISASELVMRARDLVFHVPCFSCALCSTLLTKGDTFGIRDSAVYCRLHYETMPEYGPHLAVPGPPQLCPGPYVPPAHYPPYPSPEFRGEDKGFFNGAAAPPPRQKGRPRKKKPKDQEIMTANLGMVPERAREMAADGDQAGEQDGGQVLARRLARDGHVPRPHGLHPVAAPPQPPLQRHGGAPQPQLYGLSIATVLRFVSALVTRHCL
ncbi:protein apterous-like isoform X2 [Leguminivora glycinivorella]|uniref:protein apterous-like isoform X2 n=1 Tax=Leguminivora glycinivorella TaxID=1035111 RepID=UPI00200C2259|nr:protein apterous-like isoform X2 [Leguminivora glycinivorella]